MSTKVNTLIVSLLLLMAPTTTVLAQQTPDKGNDKAKVAATTVQITNDNWQDVHVYLDQSGFLTPIGYVMSLQTETFPLPAAAQFAGGSTRILIAPLAGRSYYLSPQLLLVPGDQVQIDVNESLDLSTMWVGQGTVTNAQASHGKKDAAKGKAKADNGKGKGKMMIPAPQMAALQMWF